MIGDLALSDVQCSALVALYMDHIHDKFHSLFHRPTIMEDVAQHRLPEVLLVAIIALSAR